MEFDVLERLPRPRKRDLTVGGAVGVVERGLRGASFGDLAQVGDRIRAGQAVGAEVEARLAGLHELEDLARLGDLALDHARRQPSVVHYRSLRGSQSTVSLKPEWRHQSAPAARAGAAGRSTPYRPEGC